MAILVVFELPGMDQAAYEQITDKFTNGRGVVRTPADWPVPGLISHVAAPTPNGWFVTDVWESEAAFRQFGEVLAPLMRELGVPDAQPKIYPVFNQVTG